MIRLLYIVLLLVVAPVASLASEDDLFQSYTHNDRPYLAYFPEGEARGLVFAFHGRGGSQRYVINPGTILISETLAKAGYAIVSPQSTLRGRDGEMGAGWDTLQSDVKKNPDLQRMYALYDDLVERDLVSVETPVFTMGMSNGGGMSVFFGIAAAHRGIPVAAIANYMGSLPASGQDFINDGGPIPPMFTVIAENDGLVSGDNQLAALEFVEGRGVKVETYIGRERPVTVEGLIGAGATVEGAISLTKTLLKADMIDERGTRLYKPGEVIGREDGPTLRGVGRKAKIDRATNLAWTKLWAMHYMRDDYLPQQLAFFGEARADFLSQKETSTK